MDEYMEGVSSKKILTCIQKFCTEKVCFQGLIPDEQVSKFQNMTNHILSKEIKKESPDTEMVETIAANYTLVMTNAMSNECKENKRLSFVTDDYDACIAEQAIDKQFKLSWKYKAAEIILRKSRKRRRILVAALISIITIGLIFLGGSYLLNANAIQAEDEANRISNNVNIFEKAIGIFGGNQDRAVKVAALRSSAKDLQSNAIALGTGGVVLILLIIVGIITVSRAIVSSWKVLNDWEDYQQLCDFLKSSAKKATEAKRQWQY